MKDTVIVFARVPRLGTVKRRLARDIGDRAAMRFYALTLGRLLRALARDTRFRIIVALTPNRAAFRLQAGVTRLPQAGGDLGRRMERAFRRFPHGKTVLIGSDIPEAGVGDVVAAFRALGRADAVFGPATDGGYWLVGLGPRRPCQPFERVRWSTRNALADTLANFTAHSVAHLRRLSDVDDGKDWTAMQTEAARRRAAAPGGVSKP